MTTDFRLNEIYRRLTAIEDKIENHDSQFQSFALTVARIQRSIGECVELVDSNKAEMDKHITAAREEVTRNSKKSTDEIFQRVVISEKENEKRLESVIASLRRIIDVRNTDSREIQLRLSTIQSQLDSVLRESLHWKPPLPTQSQPDSFGNTPISAVSVPVDLDEIHLRCMALIERTRLGKRAVHDLNNSS